MFQDQTMRMLIILWLFWKRKPMKLTDSPTIQSCHLSSASVLTSCLLLSSYDQIEHRMSGSHEMFQSCCPSWSLNHEVAVSVCFIHVASKLELPPPPLFFSFFSEYLLCFLSNLYNVVLTTLSQFKIFALPFLPLFVLALSPLASLHWINQAWFFRPFQTHYC